MDRTITVANWAGHYTLEQATALVMDRFQKMIEQELQLLDLQAEKGTDLHSIPEKANRAAKLAKCSCQAMKSLSRLRRFSVRSTVQSAL